MRVLTMVAMALLLAAVLTGCSAPAEELAWGAGEGGGWTVKQEIIPVGQIPAPPDEQRVQGTEPAIPEGFAAIDADLGTFGLRWNEAADTISMPQLAVSEITTIYQKSSLAFGFRLAEQDWHTVAGSVDYASGKVFAADLEWAGWKTVAPDLESEAIPAAWVCLVYASSPAYSIDDARRVVASLTETPEGSAEIVDGGVRYRFSTTGTGEGNLTVTGAE